METLPWPTWRLVTFRFFLIYFVLSTGIWNWLWDIPVLKYIPQAISFMEDKTVNWFNQHFLHVKEELVPMNGSGDTSYGWALLCTCVFVAAAGCIIWSLVDWKRKQYNKLDYVLRLLLRYNIAMISFVYGSIKVSGLQMSFPTLSAMATPLGDFLPMRLSWMFVGYSWPYQFFSGAMEILVGLLLLNKRTVTLGSLMGLGVYAHVFILNMSYDIPVKIFSFQLLMACLYLVWCDRHRLLQFFFLNKPVEVDTAYDLVYLKTWHRWARVAVKSIFIILFVLLPLKDTWARYQDTHKPEVIPSMVPAWYNVSLFVMNGDTLTDQDSAKWKDLIFDGQMGGSIRGHVASFRPRYGRENFNFLPDTLKKEIRFTKSYFDTSALFRLAYVQTDDDHLVLQGMMNADTVYMELMKNKHHFQLGERQFHWLSEANR